MPLDNLSPLRGCDNDCLMYCVGDDHNDYADDPPLADLLVWVWSRRIELRLEGHGMLYFLD